MLISGYISFNQIAILTFNANVDSSRWLHIVRNILQDLGFSHIWNNHSTFNSTALLNAIKHTLKE